MKGCLGGDASHSPGCTDDAELLSRTLQAAEQISFNAHDTQTCCQPIQTGRCSIAIELGAAPNRWQGHFRYGARGVSVVITAAGEEPDHDAVPLNARQPSDVSATQRA